MIHILHGDCLEVLTTLPADSIDAVVTDPPYHLQSIVKRFGAPNAAPAQFGTDGVYVRMSKGFMGKQWDGGDVAFRPETWAAVLRVLKPGGYMLCFASTRGYHRMVCAIEDAGFIIHPMLGWIFGQGFPKATNLSKQLDKQAGAVRDVIEHRTLNNNRFATSGSGQEQEQFRKFDGNASITAPSTPEAKQWDGWMYGLQSLKPALEPICMAQKPAIREGMIANIRQYGTGAINVGACKVPSGQDHADKCASVVGLKSNRNGNCFGEWNGVRTDSYDAAGRWPTNVIHDGSPEVEAAFAAFGESKSPKPYIRASGSNSQEVYGKYASRDGEINAAYGDTGTASRFFKECKWEDHELAASINASDAAQTFDLQSELVSFALSNAVAQSMQPLALQSTSYQGQNMSVLEPELRLICASVTALIQNIASKCSQDWPHGKLFLSNDPVYCVAQQKRTGITTITISLWKSSGYVEAATFNIIAMNLEAGVEASQSRFHYSAKASKHDRAGSKHPTIKPISLIRYLCRLITPPNGTILDPFAGSGTTAEAAMIEGFSATLIERDPASVADIRHRIERWSGGDAPLFADVVA